MESTKYSLASSIISAYIGKDDISPTTHSLTGRLAGLTPITLVAAFSRLPGPPNSAHRR